MVFALVIFFVSAFSIAGIFGLKHWEERSGRVLLPEMRRDFDARALHTKDLLHAAQADLEKLPPELLHFSRVGVHIAALAVARFARIAETQAYRLADLVSHKHRFARKAPRSEFLKKVIEHKNGGQNETPTPASEPDVGA